MLLSSVLPVVKQIHREQCFEVELEKKLRGKSHFKVYLVFCSFVPLVVIGCLCCFSLCGDEHLLTL